MANRAELKIDGLPEDYQYVDFKSFVEFLTKHLVVSIPSGITNVVISSTQPSENERESVWIRRNNAGSFVGMYIYSGGSWVQMYPAPKQVIWMHGLSSELPPGYRLIEEGHPDFSEYQLSFFRNQYLQKEGTSDDYVYFAVTYTGV